MLFPVGKTGRHESWRASGVRAPSFLLHGTEEAGTPGPRSEHAMARGPPVTGHPPPSTSVTLAGLEPAIFGSEDQRLIHEDTGRDKRKGSLAWQSQKREEVHEGKKRPWQDSTCNKTDQNAPLWQCDRCICHPLFYLDSIPPAAPRKEGKKEQKRKTIFSQKITGKKEAMDSDREETN